jgi:hypothetical protein
MNILKLILAVVASCVLAGCTIESDIILPDPTAAGEVIAGFPADAPFKLETFDSKTNAYKAFATLTPERETDAVRYIVSLDDGTPNRLVVQARKMSENNYLIRFSQRIEGIRPNLDESGLAFLTVKDGTYYLMSSMSDDGWLEEIFKGETLPRGAGTSNIRLDSMDQAARISSWFADNYPRLGDRRDYVRFRVAR